MASSQDQCDLWTLAWHRLRYQHTAALRSRLAERYAPATVNKMLAALRGTLKECWRLGLMDAEDYHRAADLPAVRGSTLPRGRALSAGELRALLGACAQDKSVAGRRDGALVATLYGAGLRRSEAVALEFTDYNQETGALTVRSGKGRKDRMGYAPGGSRAALEAWLPVRGMEAGPLFVPINKAGKLTLRAMSDQAVLYILRKRAREAGLTAFSPMTCGARSLGTCWTPGQTLPPFSRWPVTLMSRPLPATTDGGGSQEEGRRTPACTLLTYTLLTYTLLTYTLLTYTLLTYTLLTYTLLTYTLLKRTVFCDGGGRTKPAWGKVKVIMDAAGLGVAGFPKGLRHGFRGGRRDNGIPLNMVQKWLGHAQLSTTAIYADTVGATRNHRSSHRSLRPDCGLD